MRRRPLKPFFRRIQERFDIEEENKGINLCIVFSVGIGDVDTASVNPFIRTRIIDLLVVARIISRKSIVCVGHVSRWRIAAHCDIPIGIPIGKRRESI